MSPAIIWLITSILFLIGLAGIILPGVPGILLVFGGVLFFGWITGFQSISVLTVILIGVAAALGWLAEYAGGLIGAKFGGGGKATAIGIFAGAIIGLITSGPPGVILGSVLGAVAGAWYVSRKADTAIRVAAFSLLGIVSGKAVQFLMAIAMIVAFGLAVAF